MGSGGPKIAIVGAGGWVFPLEIARDILAHPSLSACTLALYDIRPETAERTLRDVETLIELGGLAARAEVTGTLRDALTGTDFIVTVFQVGGVDAYGFDIEIPREYGVDQTVGDTLGPGGVFRGLRSVEALRVVAQTMHEICPNALLLNYVNPMSINCWATDLLGVNVVGLCHSVPNTAQLLADELGVPYEEVTFECAGVNHTAWFTTFRRGEQDLIPAIRETMTKRYLEGRDLPARSDDPYEGNEKVRTELMRLTGYFHTESSHHASDYWAWFRKNPQVTKEYLDRRWDYLDICRGADTGEDHAETIEEARREGLRPGGEFAAPIIDSIVTGTPRVVYGNVRNGTSISNLPEDACVEIPCVVDGSGLRPTRYGALPAVCAALNQVQINVQRLAVQAAMTGDSDLVHAALALDPLTSALLTLPQVHEMADRMLEAEAEWLPQFRALGRG
jgi:alpha-galactosidase